MANGLTTEEREFRKELASANINPDSFLATDYLNHFNEIVMLLEMAVDVPELIDDAEAWQPKSYVEHFENSGFVARDLVVKAWDLASPTVRTRFEGVVARLDDLILMVLDSLKASLTEGALDESGKLMIARNQSEIQTLLLDLNGIIHSGQGHEMAVADNQETEVSFDETNAGSDAQSQDEIDQLFD